MRFFLIATIVALAIFQGGAEAAECAGAPTQTAMNECVAANFQSADTRLNTIYGQIMNRLRTGDEVKRQLIESERAWLQFRDAECAFVANTVAGGSAYPMVVTGCKTTMTKDRIKQLGGYLTCVEGDLSCPLPPK